jgi:hypothetical protein
VYGSQGTGGVSSVASVVMPVAPSRIALATVPRYPDSRGRREGRDMDLEREPF